jgi:hypothetical protein
MLNKQKLCHLKGQGRFMCAGAGIKYNPNGYTPKDTTGLVNRGNVAGMTMYTKPYAGEATSSMPQSSASPQPMTQQQVQPASMPRATTGRFSFNNGNFRIGDSTMSDSDTGLNI